MLRGRGRQDLQAPAQPGNCGTFFLGDYIAVPPSNSGAQVLYTGNGPAAMDVFSLYANF